MLLERPYYYGQPELTHPLILHVLTGESPEETRKLVTYEQIVEHWQKFTASEGTNSEFMSPSESLKDTCTRTVLMQVKCLSQRESVRLHRNA